MYQPFPHLRWHFSSHYYWQLITYTQEMATKNESATEEVQNLVFSEMINY